MLEESPQNIVLAAQATRERTKVVTPRQENSAPVEEKPFPDFIQQDYIPALKQAFIEKEITDLHVNLEHSKIAVNGFETAPECSQVVGCWNNVSGTRQFNIYFFEDDIQGQRAISCGNFSHTASTIESFLVLDRKITLDLLVLWLVQRLISQQWLR
jgi:Protein of unknown function (DUF2996)